MKIEKGSIGVDNVIKLRIDIVQKAHSKSI